MLDEVLRHRRQAPQEPEPPQLRTYLQPVPEPHLFERRPAINEEHLRNKRTHLHIPLIISQFHLLHMLRHLPRANVVNIGRFIPCLMNTLVDALLELALVKLHSKHVKVHLVLCLSHTLVILLKGFILQTSGLFHSLHYKEFLLDLGVHQFQPECLLCRFALEVLKHKR